MKWTQRRFNPDTLRVEQVPLSRREILRGVALRGLLVLGIGASSVWLVDQLFQSPADRARDREIAFLEGQLGGIREEMTLMEAAMEDISERDDAVYRTILGVPPVLDCPDDAETAAIEKDIYLIHIYHPHKSKY